MKGFYPKKIAENSPAYKIFLISLGALGGIVFIVSYFMSFSYSHINGNNHSAYHIVPEYDRYLRKVVISLDKKRSTLRLHSGLLDLLPDYTDILVLLPDSGIKAIREELKNKPYGERTRLVGFKPEDIKNANVYLLFPEEENLISSSLVDTAIPQGSLWAQDLFEAAVDSKRHTTLLISDLHKWFVSNNSKDPYQVVSDNAFVGSLMSTDLKVKRLPVTFKGGNILIDVRDGRRIAFCGGDVLRQTRTVWKSTKDQIPSYDEIIAMLKKHLNVDEVIVIGKDKEQPSLMFHLDQVMTIFPDGVVLITRIVQNEDEEDVNSGEIEDVRRFLSESRLVFEGLGYRIINMYTSARNASNHRYYVNGIPFINEESGQREFFMPVFINSQTPFNKENLRKNIAAIEKLGYKVTQVPTKADKLRGGIHCLFNVIS